MRRADFLLLMFVCFIWAVNVVIGKLVFVHMAVPPIYYAAIRFLLVAGVLAPLLRPLPEQLGRIAIVALLVGAGHFGLLFLGLTASTPSSAAIVLQLGIPFTAILSVTVLRERTTTKAVVGTVVALAGVLVVIWNPDEMRASIGLLAIVGSTLSLSVGSILLKRLRHIEPLRLQAWVGVISWLPLALASLTLESNQLATSLDGGWLFLAALVFSVVVVTVWAHTSYYGLLRRYDANLIAPLTLAMPIITVALGVLITGDAVGPRQIAGSVVALAGVALVLTGRPAPLRPR
ncbi:DMT family transporter [Ancylobacter sp. Lp-2]|uniref:DMT family transporter n=1 Tax=Ancylobacter sp. Lp-2 TaxID=2881339 RepID=UPI001E57AC1D|nr:DMT family transporter [Ancylobacter sp. Lp-2]MCB4768818.1 DMT family transporter [Ancylobacter sp. Lp-2]